MSSQTITALASASLSKCTRYRYALERAWNDRRPSLGWLMLNPSKADAQTSDRTLEACIAFSQRAGFGSLRIENLFAYRATHPRDLFQHGAAGGDIVGPLNDRAVAEMIETSERIVIAWGAVNQRVVRERVRQVLPSLPTEVWCLGTTKGGDPRHPSRLAYSTRLVRYACQAYDRS